jgi:predicted small secreted protein
MKKFALLIIAASIALTGCNTIAGAGKDIQRGGQAITNAADR